MELRLSDTASQRDELSFAALPRVVDRRLGDSSALGPAEREWAFATVVRAVRLGDFSVQGPAKARLKRC